MNRTRCTDYVDPGHPLATGFHMDEGYVPIKVPNKIPERSDYICVGKPPCNSKFALPHTERFLLLLMLYSSLRGFGKSLDMHLR
jgi:hypothetical protein